MKLLEFVFHLFSLPFSSVFFSLSSKIRFLLNITGIIRRCLVSPEREYRFTLIELLVVVAIIAILAGMLLPALNSARDRAMTISCLSRQKQYTMACQLYADSYNEWYFPPYADTAKAPQNSAFGAGSSYNMSRAMYDLKILTNAKSCACPKVLQAKNIKSNAPGTLTWAGYGMIEWGRGADLQKNSAVASVKEFVTGVGFLKDNYWSYYQRFSTAGASASQRILGGDTVGFNGSKFTDRTQIGEWWSVNQLAVGVLFLGHVEKTNVFYLDGHAAAIGFSELATCGIKGAISPNFTVHTAY